MVCPRINRKLHLPPTHAQGSRHFSLNGFPDDGLTLSSLSPLLCPVLFWPSGQGVQTTGWDGESGLEIQEQLATVRQSQGDWFRVGSHGPQHMQIVT